MKRLLSTAIMTSLIVMLSALSAFAEGEITSKLYGSVTMNAQFNNRIKADIPTVAGIGDTTNHTNFLMTARQTRFGLQLGYENMGWKVGGHIELDFWGLLGSGKNGGSMQSAPRLRRAYFTMTKDRISLLFGQEWVVFAPLSPVSDAHVSIPALSSSGNLWNRMPQIRMEVKMPVQANELLLQLALLRPLGADNVTTGQADYIGAGELSAMPFMQGRVAMSFGKTATIGVSGHFGQEDFSKLDATFDEDEKTTTFAAAVDLTAGNNVVKLMAEGFTGKNLIMLFSNASYRKVLFDDVDTTYKNEPIKVIGGWGAFTLTPKNSKVSFNLGAGMEVLDKDEVESMAGTATTLYRNMTLFGNIMYTPIPKIGFAVEVGHIATTYKRTVSDELEEVDGKNLSINVSSKISF
jgi:hypothetical protein